MPYTIKPGSFKYKKSNGQFSEIDCFEGPDLTEEVAALEKGKAPIIIDSAVGNPIAIKDGADNLPIEGMKIHFNPVQDLHGYDSPWPAGGGKNKLSVDIDVAEGLNPGFTRNGNTLSRNGVDFTFNDDGTIKVNGTATGNYSYLTLCEATFLSDSSSGTYVLNGCPSGGAASKYNIDVAGASGCDTGNGISLTYTGTLANVAVRIRVTENTTVNNLIFKPMIRLASVTDDTFAPYSNICPIEGWTGFTAWRTGVNVWDEEWEVGAYNTSTGAKTGTSAGRIRSAGFIPVIPGSNYKVVGNVDGVCYYDKSKNYLSYSINNSVITIPDDCYFITFYSKTNYGSVYNHDISINYPSTDTEYHPYTGQSYPVTFPATGKNLLNPAKYSFDTTTTRGLTFSVQSDGSIKVTGTTESSDFGPSLTARFQLPAGTYYGYKDDGNVYVTYRKSTAEIGGETSGLISPFTLNGTEWVYCNIYVRSPGTFDTTIHPQIARENTQTAYEPFTNTIYGGTLDVINRVLTVKWAKTFLNGSETGWNYYNQNTAFSVPIVGMKNVSAKQVICDRFKQIKNIVDYGVYAGAVNEYAYFIRATDIEGVSDMDSWKAYLAENPIEFAFELATPYEIQLDPITITTLLGDNIIWSDANGDIELDYRADTKLFCQKNDQVDDVQINGTSILDAQGVANVPKATDTSLGVVKGRYYGVRINADGDMYISMAAGSEVKAGTSNYLPIVPANQQSAVFYGLAKLAGADMAQSSNPVGTFTDDALVKIQKMLGVYQSPWELIRQDSVTNESASDIEIAVDGNGISLALTDLALQLTIPADSNTIISSYGMINLFYYTGADTYVPVMLNNFSGPKQHAWFGSVYANCVNGFVQASCSQYSESGNNRPVQVRNTFDFFPASSSAIIKIVIKNVQGTIDYKLYGRRKWTT